MLPSTLSSRRHSTLLPPLPTGIGAEYSAESQAHFLRAQTMLNDCARLKCNMFFFAEPPVITFPVAPIVSAAGGIGGAFGLTYINGFQQQSSAFMPALQTPQQEWPSSVLPLLGGELLSSPLALQRRAADVSLTCVISPRRAAPVTTSPEKTWLAAPKFFPSSTPVTEIDDSPATSPRAHKRAKMDQDESGESDEGADQPDAAGERRLTIVFDSFGSAGAHPQFIGKRATPIPDGLSGTFSKYAEQWEFRVRHGSAPVLCPDKTERVCVTWSIRNSGSGTVVEQTETAKEATLRETIGRTICNRVFRLAVEQRRDEYAQALAAELESASPNGCKVANLKSLVAMLSAKRFAQGPLVFGLYHRAVQASLEHQ